MPSQPIENYGSIGNLRTAALVGRDGSIDWLCLPRFDAPSVFGAILDDEKGGRYRIAPAVDGARRKQFYWPDTNVLVTRFLHPDGILEVIDFMPVPVPGRGRRPVPPDGRLLAPLAEPGHLRRPVAGPSVPVGPGPEAVHLRADRGDRRGPDDQLAGGDRRGPQLGLPVHLGPRRLVHPVRPAPHRLHRRGGAVHGLAPRPVAEPRPAGRRPAPAHVR